MNRHSHPFFTKQVGIGHLAVGEHLLLILILNLGVKLASPLFGGLKRSNPKSFVDGGVTMRRKRRGQIDEGGSHLPPVAEFDRPLAEPAPGNDANSVRRTTVDLDKGDQALPVRAFGIVDAKALAPEHRHPDPEDLPGAEVAMGNFGFAQESVKGLHNLMILLDARAMFFAPLHDVARQRYYSNS
jgi:hypothetical protein